VPVSAKQETCKRKVADGKKKLQNRGLEERINEKSARERTLPFNSERK